MAHELKVFSTIAVQSALEVLVPTFEQQGNLRLAMTWNTAPVLVKRLQDGEVVDVFILNRTGLDTMIREGRVQPGSEVTLAQSATAIAIRAGDARPDISTPEELKRTLLAARRISYSDPAAGGASGIHFAKVLDRLGIAAEVNAKTMFPPPAGLTGDFLSTGAVDLAIQQRPELLQVPGIEILRYPARRSAHGHNVRGRHRLQKCARCGSEGVHGIPPLGSRCGSLSLEGLGTSLS
jgi:molybdate transport system substrate-binding protein